MTTIAGALTDARWFTSSYSNNQGGECVEGAHLPDGRMAIRDSKDPAGPVLLFDAEAWSGFAAAVKDGSLGGGRVDG